MRILFVTNLENSPGGGGVFSKSIMEVLQGIGEVDKYILQDRNAWFWFGRYLFWMVIGWAFLRLPFRISYYYSSKALRFFRKNGLSYDLIVLDHLESTWILRFNILPLNRLMYVSHNDECALFSARIKNNKLFSLVGMYFPYFHKIIINFLLRDFEAYQNDVLINVPKVLTISDDVFNKIRGASSRVLPFFSYSSFRAKKKSNFQVPSIEKPKLRLGFFGNLDWWPNKNGLAYFINNVLFPVRELVVLNVYGYGVQNFFDEILINQDVSINPMGFSESLDDIWSQIDVMIVPVFEGAGANVKFAEILFNGIPVIVSRFVYKQYEQKLIDDPGIAVCDNDNDWMDAIRRYASKIPESIDSRNSDLFTMDSAKEKILKLING